MPDKKDKAIAQLASDSPSHPTMKSPESKPTVLLVDDEVMVRNSCTNVLKKLGYEVVVVDGAAQALKRAKLKKFDVLLTDIRMPEMTGDVLITCLKKLQPDIIPIIMTGFPSVELAIDAIHKDVSEFIAKPFGVQQLQETLKNALEKKAATDLRAQREFAAGLLRIQNDEADGFVLRKAIEDLLGAVADASDSSKRQDSEKESAELRAVENLWIAVLCEPIPKDRKRIKTSPDYRHFRLINAVGQLINKQLNDFEPPIGLKLSLANNSADIPNHFRKSSDQICCIIFGPNHPRLSEATVRMAANSSQDKYVVVCYNPDTTSFKYDRLAEFESSMNIRGYKVSSSDEEAREFWASFCNKDLKPLT